MTEVTYLWSEYNDFPYHNPNMSIKLILLCQILMKLITIYYISSSNCRITWAWVYLKATFYVNFLFYHVIISHSSEKNHIWHHFHNNHTGERDNILWISFLTQTHTNKNIVKHLNRFAFTICIANIYFCLFTFVLWWW